MPDTAARSSRAGARGRWPWVATVLVAGYLCMGRTFAYLGVPQLKIFMGEVVLGTFLLSYLPVLVGAWGPGLVKPAPLSGLLWSLLLLIGYGAFEVLRGIAFGYDTLTALQCFAFNYYPLYLFLGLAVGLWDPGFLPRLVRSLAWIHALYGTAYLLVLNRLTAYKLPGTTLSLFGLPMAPAVVLLAMLVFQRTTFKGRPFEFRLLLALNAFVLLGMQGRGQWLAFIVGLLVLVWTTNRVRPLAMGALTVATLLTFFALTGLELPGPASRGGTISVTGIAARFLSAFSRTLAVQYSDEAWMYAESADWRTIWWTQIWRSVHETPELALAGHGYGFPLPSVAPGLHFPDTEALEAAGMALRTPHSFFFYVLGYGGWVGMAVTLGFLLALARLLREGCRRSGHSFGIVLLAAVLTDACFTSTLDSPYGAIPFYILAGLAIAPAVAPARSRIQARAVLDGRHRAPSDDGAVRSWA